MSLAPHSAAITAEASIDRADAGEEDQFFEGNDDDFDFDVDRTW
jgi:hypothetical protein